MLDGGDFVRNFHTMSADSRDDRAARFDGQHFWSEYAGFLSAKILDEKRRGVGCGVSDGRREAALLANLVERWEHRVRTDQQMLILLCTAFYSAHEHRR